MKGSMQNSLRPAFFASKGSEEEKLSRLSKNNRILMIFDNI
jgi:hypothetical protein